jgi:outer membrane protein assembly factor BamB
VIALVYLGLLVSSPTYAQGGWPQWRGSDRTGSLPGAPSRTAWPERLIERWVREVGEGYSGPVAVADRIWIHTRKGRREIVRSLRLDDGSEVWSAGYDAEFEQDRSARAHGRGPYSTPSMVDGRLFTLGVTAILSAWDADSGKLLWRRDYSREFDPSHPFFGAAASPLVRKDLCFVHFGASEGQKPGNPGLGAMVALRARDGKEVWRWDADGPSIGASPVLHAIEGQEQLVFKSRENIVGLDPLTGRELWRIPFEVTEDNTIVTPLFLENRLLTSDYRKGFHAWQIVSEGESWTARHLWKNNQSLFMSSPVFAAGLVVGFSHRRSGQLFALDPKDGTVLWRGEPRWGEHASLVSRGDQVLVFRENGWLVVGQVSRERFQLLGEYRVGGSPMWGHPAIVPGRILIKDGARLASYQLPGD